MVPATATVPRVLLTIREAAESIHVSDRTLYNLRDRGLVRFVKLGKSVRIPMADIAALASGGAGEGSVT